MAMPIAQTPAPTSLLASGGDGGGAGDADGEDWALALVLGVMLGVLLLGVCWCWCYSRGKPDHGSANVDKRSKSSNDPLEAAAVATAPRLSTETSAVVDDEEAAIASAIREPAALSGALDNGETPAAATAAAAAAASAAGAAAPPVPAATSAAVVDEELGGGVPSQPPPPPGHDGALPASTPAGAGTAAPGAKLEPVSATLLPRRMLSVSSSSSFSPSVASSSRPPSVVATTTLGLGEGGGGGGGGELVTLRSSRGVSTFATPENYGEFPQPFSGMDVRVVPYERTNSRSSNGGGGRRGSFVASEGDDGEGAGSGGEGGWPQPEADVADLVMDNNEFYTPNGGGGGGGGGGDGGAEGGGGGNNNDRALREAVVMVAAAAAETKAFRRKSSYAASNGTSSFFHSFDSGAGEEDTVSGSGCLSFDTDSDAPSASEDKRLAVAAVAAAAAAAKKAPPSAESDHNGWDTSFSTEASAHGPGGRRRPSVASVFSGNGSERGGGGDGGALVPPTPRSLPGLLSMSFSASMIEEGLGKQQQQLSPNGNEKSEFEGDVEDPMPEAVRPPATGGGAVDQQQQQLQKRPFRRSSSRYSSDAEDGSWMALPPLPEAGGASGRCRGGRRRGASARYPFLRGASAGSSEAGAAVLSRTASSLVDSSEDEAQAFAVRADSEAESAGALGTAEALGTTDPDGRKSSADAGTDSDGSSSDGDSGSSDQEALVFPVGDDGDLPTVQHASEEACPAKTVAVQTVAAKTAAATSAGEAAVDATAPKTMPPKYKKMESSSSSFDEQPFCFSSDSGLFSLASSNKMRIKTKDGNARRFFQSGGGSGTGASGSSGGGLTPGMMSGVLSSCVGLTPPETPGAAAAAATSGKAGAGKALHPAGSFDTGRLTDTVGWNGENPPESNRVVGANGSRGFAAAAGGEFDTGHFFACGDDGGSGAARGGGAAVGRTTRFDSTGLFDSTKRWFDSVSTIAGGGAAGEGEPSAQGGCGQPTVAIESSLFDTE